MIERQITGRYYSNRTRIENEEVIDLIHKYAILEEGLLAVNGMFHPSVQIGRDPTREFDLIRARILYAINCLNTESTIPPDCYLEILQTEVDAWLSYREQPFV